jgi:hypothetical protein
MAQELDSMVNFTLGHHCRGHWNSTGLEATPSGPSHHSITHTHHHDNTSNTQQPQQLHNSHYTHVCCRTTTLSHHYGAGTNTKSYLLTLDMCSFWAGPFAISRVNLPCSFQNISHHSCNLHHLTLAFRLVHHLM